MLGIYENFPENIHKITTYAVSISTKKLQETLVRVFREINRKTFNLEDVADPSVPNCTIIFELGIAEARDFNYLDDAEASVLLKAIKKKPFQIMDFYCAIRYYKIEGERKAPLKFDYYMIRAMFNKNSMETRIFHERGPRYTSPDYIVSFLIKKINETFSRRVLKVLETV
jgi:hypothetical protein